jgi:signal peptidase I
MISEEKPYNKKIIGRKIANAGEHIVYRYGENQIIKFPSGPIYYANPEEAYNKVENEFRLANKYFKKFLVPTQLVTYKEKDCKRYCIIQDFVENRPLNPKDMQDENLKMQFKEIMEANNRMYLNSRFTLELFGLKGLILHNFFPKMENIVVTQDNTLRIMDFGMISHLNLVSSSPILRWFIQWAVKRQGKLLREKYFIN